MQAAPLFAALLLLLAGAATAAPVELTVRIEGATRTLFEGPILSDGHSIRASSDSLERPCDGTNGGANPAPGPTPTAAGADAMGLVGQGFDGEWTPLIHDYFIERWGPDAQSGAALWGVWVNERLLSVGGCQRVDAAGDEALWAYDAFSGRTLLRLAAAADLSQPPTPPAPTAHVEVGEPLALRVQSLHGGEGQTPAVEPAGGVTVAPVATEAGTGYETVETADPAAVATAADGSASLTFSSPGWHRLKAQSEADHIRSNRLDVCVEPAGGGSCGPLPADAQLRIPPRYLGSGGGEPPPAPPPPAPTPSPTPAPVRLALGRVTVDPRRGTASIEAVVSGAGRLALSGGRIRPRSADVRAAGAVRLTVLPTAAARRSLRRQGRLRAEVRVTFDATGGGELRRGLGLSLRLRRSSR